MFRLIKYLQINDIITGQVDLSKLRPSPRTETKVDWDTESPFNEISSYLTWYFSSERWGVRVTDTLNGEPEIQTGFQETLLRGFFSNLSGPLEISDDYDPEWGPLRLNQPNPTPGP